MSVSDEQLTIKINRLKSLAIQRIEKILKARNAALWQQNKISLLHKFMSYLKNNAND